jgi:DNA-binding transcriptional LysR family regulator
VHEAPDPQAQLALVAAGIGIGLHLAPATTRRERGVVFIALAETIAIPALALVWRRDDDRDLVRLFLNTARQVARSLDDTWPGRTETDQGYATGTSTHTPSSA